MPDMAVRSIEDTNLNMVDFEVGHEPKEIQFIIEGKFCYNV